jgi:hypothetical protein
MPTLARQTRPNALQGVRRGGFQKLGKANLVLVIITESAKLKLDRCEVCVPL